MPALLPALARTYSCGPDSWQVIHIGDLLSAYEFHPPPSGYGPYVDAVGRKAAEYCVLSERARVEARLAALKRRLTARLAQALADAGKAPSGR